MDKLKKYQQIVINYLNTQKERSGSSSRQDIVPHIIIDKENNHFQFLKIGWHRKQFVFAVIHHFEIKNNKIWIQQNNTEQEIAEILLEQGVPPADIVLGFRSPYARQFTGFGIE